MNVFLNTLVYSFMIAFGVILGASFFAGLGAIINDQPPVKTMLDLAGSIKVWAVAVALGGTFSSFEIIEKGIFNGEIKSIIKQSLYIITALAGANSGYNVIKLIYKVGKAWFAHD